MIVPRTTNPHAFQAIRRAKRTPMLLVHRLQTTLTGCEWLLDQWFRLHKLLEKDAPWLPADKLKAVRLSGWHPIDAIDSMDAAQIYLATHVLSNDGGEPLRRFCTSFRPIRRRFLNATGSGDRAPSSRLKRLSRARVAIDAH